MVCMAFLPVVSAVLQYTRTYAMLRMYDPLSEHTSDWMGNFG